MAFFLGVVMLIMGVGLCAVGDVTLPGGRRVKVIPARWAGGISLAFIPLAVVLHFTISQLNYWLDVDLNYWLVQLINCLLALICLGTSLGILWRNASSPKKVNRKTVDIARGRTEENPFFVDHGIDVELVDPRELQEQHRRKKNR